RSDSNANSGSDSNANAGKGGASGSGSGSGSGSANRSRRRRRGGRGRGSGSGGNSANSHNAQKNQNSQNSQSSRNSGNAPDGAGPTSGAGGTGVTVKDGGSPKKDSPKNSQAKSGSGKGSQRSGSRSGARSGSGRGGQRRRQANQSKGRPGRRPAAGRPSQRGGEQRDRMRTSIETSAGGLVVSGLAEAVGDDGNVDLSRIYVALIGRLDRRGRLLWSMPKGHVEPGEAHDSTAEREVWEETGIHGEVIAELGVIDYWFISDGTRIHKTVHHHLLRYVDGDLNDEDPEVTEVTWFPASTLVERLAYADERKLARRAHDLLPDLAKAEKDAGKATPR
ncbi:MAG: NUDIX hydrolase, partial [Corynebacterium sp.]|nr:NUDIX hydrolase [Corynebacterium sp.]